MRIAITLAVALCVGTVPVLRADDAVAPQPAAATADYTADGRLPLATIMGRFDALSTAGLVIVDIVAAAVLFFAVLQIRAFRALLRQSNLAQST